MKENETSFGTIWEHFICQNEIIIRQETQPTYLPIQLFHMCTTSQVTYLMSESVNQAEPKIVPFEACKGCC